MDKEREKTIEDVLNRVVDKGMDAYTRALCYLLAIGAAGVGVMFLSVYVTNAPTNTGDPMPAWPIVMVFAIAIGAVLIARLLKK